MFLRPCRYFLRCAAPILTALVICVSSAWADPPIQTGEAPYFIHSGDQLSVQVYGEQTLTQTVTVLQDGTINYPLVGSVAVAGKTPSDATKILRKDLLRYLRNPLVSIAVMQEGHPNAMVLGAVDHPGQIPLNDGDRLSMVIAKAGNSANSNADLNHIQLTRTNPDGTKTISKINLYEALVQGQTNVDVAIQPNDLIYVPAGHRQDSGVVTGILYFLRSLIP